MTLPGASPEDVAEQAVTPDGAASGTAEPQVPDDAPDADVLEQVAPAGPVQDVDARPVPGESDEADAVEQTLIVELDEDDYRE